MTIVTSIRSMRISKRFYVGIDCWYKTYAYIPMTLVTCLFRYPQHDIMDLIMKPILLTIHPARLTVYLLPASKASHTKGKKKKKRVQSRTLVACCIAITCNGICLQPRVVILTRPQCHPSYQLTKASYQIRVMFAKRFTSSVHPWPQRSLHLANTKWSTAFA